MKKIAIRKELFLLMIPFSLLLATAVILKNDFLYYIKTWGFMFASGIAFYPLSSLIFKNFSDKGWIFSKVFGFSIPALIVWILSDLKILAFNNFSCYIFFGICFILNYAYLFWHKHKKGEHLQDIFNYKVLKRIIILESIFIILFTFWFYYKGTSPMIDDKTEKFMDYGFLNSILNTEHMPPEDIWFSRNSINYYYYGLYVIAFICKMASLQVNEGYNIAVALIATFSFVMPLSIVYQALIYSNKQKHNDSTKYVVLAILFSIFAGIGSCFGGTMHYTIYRLLAPKEEGYYYPDETRYIGYDVDRDYVVTEKPAYSNLLGDLHAHYVAIIFSYTTMALLLAFFISDNKQGINIINPIILLLGILLGILKMTNYWDFPIYLVTISIMIIAKEFICNNQTQNDLLRTVIYIAEVLIIQAIITLLFKKDFNMGMSQIGVTNSSSPLSKLLVLWGIPTFCYITFLVITLKTLIDSKKGIREFLKENLSEFFMVLLGACALGLVLIPELVYVKDIYGEDYYRFNTMFKLTYEAFIMIGVCTNYGLYNIIISKSKLMRTLGSLLLFLNMTTFLYGFDAMHVLHHDYIGIDESENYIKNNMPGYVEAISWIKSNVDREKIILEASSTDSSYTTHSLISVFTGNPTVLGWTVHEWLWRTDSTLSYPEIVSERELAISEIYEGKNEEDVRKNLEEYDVSYIFVGKNEYDDYEDMDVDFLLSLGKLVYKDDLNKIYLIDVIKNN